MASRRFVFFFKFNAFPHSIQVFVRFRLVFQLLWIDIWTTSDQAGVFSNLQAQVFEKFLPKLGFVFFSGDFFFFNYVRREKSYFSVTLPQFSGDLTCLIIPAPVHIFPL